MLSKRLLTVTCIVHHTQVHNTHTWPSTGCCATCAQVKWHHRPQTTQQVHLSFLPGRQQLSASHIVSAFALISAAASNCCHTYLLKPNACSCVICVCDVVAMESIARVRDLKVMPASFAANYHSSLWTSWISCRPMCCGPQHLGACTKSTCLNIEVVDFDL